MVLLRQVLGETLRGQRLAQQRTLRQVSTAAKVSLGYLSELERGQKEASSELLAAICAALGLRLSDLFRQVSDVLELGELDASLEGESTAAVSSAVAVGVDVAGRCEPLAHVEQLSSHRPQVLLAADRAA